MLLKRKKLDLSTLADIENGAAGAEQNAVNIEDIMSALVEVGEIVAAQDDALVELAELIEESGGSKLWLKSIINASKQAS